MPVKPLEWPEPCTGPHDAQAHDHSWWPSTEPKYAGKRECSRRFRCGKCWRWFAARRASDPRCRLARSAGPRTGRGAGPLLSLPDSPSP